MKCKRRFFSKITNKSYVSIEMPVVNPNILGDKHSTQHSVLCLKMRWAEAGNLRTGKGKSRDHLYIGMTIRGDDWDLETIRNIANQYVKHGFFEAQRERQIIPSLKNKGRRFGTL